MLMTQTPNVANLSLQGFKPSESVSKPTIKLERGERLSMCGKFAINASGHWRELETAGEAIAHHMGAIAPDGSSIPVGSVSGPQASSTSPGHATRAANNTNSPRTRQPRTQAQPPTATDTAALQRNLSKKLGMR